MDKGIDKLTMSVVLRIRELIKQKKDPRGKPWNDAKLAQACGRSASWLAKKIGEGTKTPHSKITIEDLQLIAHALGIDMCDLFPSSLSYDLRKLSMIEFFQRLIGSELDKRLGRLDQDSGRAI